MLPAGLSWRRLFTAVGFVIAAVGSISLPADLDVWADHLSDIWSMARDNPLSAAAILLGVGMVLGANWDKIESYLGERKRWKSDVDLDDELHKWFREVNYALQDLPAIGASFNFSATAPRTDRPVTVLKPLLESALYLTGIIRNDDQIAVIEKMSELEVADVKADLGLEMIRLPVPISIVAEELTSAGVVVVQHAMLLTDSLTKSSFMERVVRVSSAILLVQIVIHKHVSAYQRRMGLAPTPVPQSNVDTVESRPEPA
jgi:hypothetical protein